MIFFSPKTGGFYDTDIHGERTRLAPDPSWVRPTVQVPDPEWTRPMIQAPDPEWKGKGDAPLVEIEDPDAEPPMVEAPDPFAVAPFIEEANPDCLLPDDAVAITPEQHAQLMADQESGKVITVSSDGTPVAAAPPPPTPDFLAAQARARRDQMLGASDWTQLPDAPLTADQQTAWRTRRQFLRDLPNQSKFPTKIDWGSDPQ